jgi:FtsH-binding integral membrane protein
MSKGYFAFMVSLWTAVGIVASAVAAYFTQDMGINWLFLIGVLVVSVIGVIIALKSSNPVLSLLGYALVAIPFGMMLGPVVATYTTASVVKIFAITTVIVVGLGVVGAIIPDNLEGWGSWLFGGLTVLIVGSLFVPIAGFFGLPTDGALTILDWAGVILFSGYVIYDWNRAMRVPYTQDNAIDCALAVYLDFVNLFIRLLSLRGDVDND